MPLVPINLLYVFTLLLHTLLSHRDVPQLRAKQLEGLVSLPGPESLGGWEFWDQVVQKPGSLKLPQLKEAARQLGVMVSCSNWLSEKYPLKNIFCCRVW